MIYARMKDNDLIVCVECHVSRDIKIVNCLEREPFVSTCGFWAYPDSRGRVSKSRLYDYKSDRIKC